MSGSVKSRILHALLDEPATEHRLTSLCAAVGTSQDEVMGALRELMTDGIVRLDAIAGGAAYRLSVLRRTGSPRLGETASGPNA
jgi:DNA-binding transcriptional ArsR family regulator